MKNILLIHISLLLLVSGSWASAHDFTAKLPDGNMLYFNVTDTVAHTVAVTYESHNGGTPAKRQSGRLEIPSSVKYKDVSYRVTTIGKNAFSGADSLRVVRIPARFRQLTHMGQLPALERVEVDPNNPTFASMDGLLYSRDGKTLLTCPRGRQGSVTVADGVETVLADAFAGCRALTEVILPATVRTLSYQEFSSCRNLQSLILATPMPPTTALADKVAVFALRVPSSEFELCVPAEARQLYLAALCSNEGNYTNISGGQASTCKEKDLLGRNQIKTIKKK